MDWFLYAKDLRHGRVKEHLSKILGLMYEKVKQHWGWAEKSGWLQKKFIHLR